MEENILYTLTFGLFQNITGFVDACRQVLFTNIIDIDLGPGLQFQISLWSVLGGFLAAFLIGNLVIRLFT